MRPALPFLALLAAAPAAAEVPRVLADTAPVHSLVAMVMQGVGEPGLIVPPGTSPHDLALRPSEAAALTEAELIVWTGPAFLPWLEEALATLAPDARRLALLETEGWEPLPLREAGAEEEAQADGPDDGGAIDPHAWLDPAVAAAWTLAIAEALAEADPDRAAAYRANAAAAEARLLALGEALRARLAPFADRPFVAGHDAYRYLERAAGLAGVGAIADATGAAPSPGDVGALRAAAAEGRVVCLLLDSETDPAWAETIGEGAAAPLRTATVDPEGMVLDPGPALYPALMEGLAGALESCLRG